MKSEQYIQEIRTQEGLRRAVLQKITVDGRNVTFYLGTDVRYTPEDEEYARRVTAKYVPEGMNVNVKLTKSVPEADGVKRRVAEVLKTKFPSAAAFVSLGDIEVVKDGTGGRFFIGVGATEKARFASGDIIDEISADLCRRFCGSWIGSIRIVDKAAEEIEELEMPPEEFVIGPRYFQIENYNAIDGAAPKTAIYIADLTEEAKEITVCGTIMFWQEKMTSKGKPFFSLSISDGTGTLRANYFTKRATLDKVRELAPGTSVCLTGDNEMYNGALSFRCKNIDLGSQPEGFVPEKRPSRPVPRAYRKVFPEEISDMRQGMLFDETPIPDALKGLTFVAYDIETTGLNNNATSGNMDRIIELGAVKIKDGKICERFSTFVECPVKLSEEIVNLTGIDDSMLVGAPKIGDVIADFYKFCDGCILVGHNSVGFDIKFIRYYGEQEGYFFDHRQCDTMFLSQELLFLSNNKLNTVADHFGFTFNHHRAYDDAFVTAKVFVELIKIKKCLPK